MYQGRHVIKVFILLVELRWFVFGSCNTTILYASTSKQKVSTDGINDGDLCSWRILPEWPLHPTHYLKIKWIEFSVDAQMPECYNEYVEVAVKKENYSLGRFCSGNTDMRRPFTMYASDGHATITFRVNTKKGSRFAFHYSMQRRRESSCREQFHSSDVDIDEILTFPKKERQICNFVSMSKFYQKTKIVFMEFNFGKRSKNCTHGIAIRGSESPNKAGELVLEKSCGIKIPFSLIYSFRRLDITIDCQSKSRKGVLMGIVRYGTKESIQGRFAKFTMDDESGEKPTIIVGEQKKPNKNVVLGVSIGLVVVGIILFLLIPVLIYCLKGRRSEKKGKDSNNGDTKRALVTEIH